MAVWPLVGLLRIAAADGRPLGRGVPTLLSGAAVGGLLVVSPTSCGIVLSRQSAASSAASLLLFSHLAWEADLPHGVPGLLSYILHIELGGLPAFSSSSQAPGPSRCSPGTIHYDLGSYS